MATPNPQSLSAYRALLRATRICFNGDQPLLTASRTQARTQFLQNKSLPSNSTELTAAITHAREVATILRQNIVQGVKTEEAEEGSRPTTFGVERGGSYQLRIHAETERGDNDTIKNPKGGKAKVHQGCGSA